MKKISLSEVEVNDLIDLYQSEIDRAQRRISNLKTIIKKISDGKHEDAAEEKPLKTKLSKRGRKPKALVSKVEKESTSEPKKRGRKPKVSEPIAKIEPKKRGRKPKVNESVANVEPKKRGRKPKLKVVETPAKKDSTIKISQKVKAKKNAKVKSVNAEPKKRGRKPIKPELKASEGVAEVKVIEKKVKAKASKKKNS